MSVVTQVLVRPKEGVDWETIQGNLKRSVELIERAGGENVTVSYAVAAGEFTNIITVRTTAENWTKFGEIQEKFWSDPDVQAHLQEAAQTATWRTYLSATIDI